MPRDRILEWSSIASSHAHPNAARRIQQLLTTAMPLARFWAAMMIAVDHAYWMALLLSVPAAAFTVRLFIIQHDADIGRSSVHAD